MEIWKDVDIIGFEGRYQVSNQGRVNSLLNGIIKIGTNSHGYQQLNLSKNGKRKNMKVSMLVAMFFLGHKPDGTHKIVVDHIDNNPLNDRLSNLQLITQRQNTSKDKKGITGVSKHGRKYRACIYKNGKQNYIGLFKTENDASVAYQARI